MNADTIRKWLRREPFEAFELRLSNGEHYEVRHPELVALARSHMAIADPAADHITHVALVHVNSIAAVATV